MPPEKEIEFRKENFDNVRFTENCCLAGYKGNADNVNDLGDQYTFLDTVVLKEERFRNEPILDIKTHYKPSESCQCTHFNSCQQPRVKNGFIKGEAMRIIRTLQK